MKNLYVGNIPEEVTEEELRNALSTKAVIQKVGIFKERDTDKSLGFGYLTIDEKSEADIKAKLSGYNIKGRKIVLN